VKCLDLFCGAGGATKGLQLAGYHVTGVDSTWQPRYCGDALYQDDAFAWLRGEREALDRFDLIWASPKCQGHSVLTPARTKGDHEIQLPRVLELLRAQPVPFIVENVESTQGYMRNPVMLCGSMFGLEIWRHRWFELGNTDAFFLLPPCNHDGHPILISGRGMRGVAKGGTRPSEPLKAEKMRGIGIDWMVTKELDQAIPPAYSRFLAEQIQEVLACP
jgi:DNA (cytosine-5)-methyltransferase 1